MLKSEPLRVGLAGLGTVGSGVVNTLRQNQELIEKRVGRSIIITAFSARNINKKRNFDTDGIPFVPLEVLPELENVDVIVELIGGHDGVAYDLVKSAISKSKSVVTANKALIAYHGLELARLAEINNVSLAFEGSVAGGIPILKSIREGFSANNIHKFYGILNGTCNYILSKMEATGASFEEVLKEAQELGFAEEDPLLDINGVDAAHKVAILSSLAFGTEINFDSVYIRGIESIKALDIKNALDLGYRIRLLGYAKKTNLGIVQKVCPMMLSSTTPISSVYNEQNAIVIETATAGSSFFSGQGAGSTPTGSAVIADIIDIARMDGRTLPPFGITTSELQPYKSVMSHIMMTKYYIRLAVRDRIGVVAQITAVFRDYNISIESLIQRGRLADTPVNIVFVTYYAQEQDINLALGVIAQLDDVIDPPQVLPISNL